MTGTDHMPEDYTHPSWDWSQSELVIEMVQGAREGGANGVENLKCPRTTALETDAVTCGINNVVGGDCEFKRNNVVAGVGFCAQNGTSSAIECWDACDYSINVETAISGAPEGTRAKIEYKRNQQCPSWWLNLLKVLGLMILVALLILGIMYLCWQMKLRNKKQKRTRALEQDPPSVHGYQHVPTQPPQPPEPSSPPGPPGQQLSAMTDTQQALPFAQGYSVTQHSHPYVTATYSASPSYSASPAMSSRVTSGYPGYATYQPAAMSSSPGFATGPMYTGASTQGRMVHY